jgi:hypothetical protein
MKTNFATKGKDTDGANARIVLQFLAWANREGAREDAMVVLSEEAKEIDEMDTKGMAALVKRVQVGDTLQASGSRASRAGGGPAGAADIELVSQEDMTLLTHVGM